MDLDFAHAEHAREAADAEDGFGGQGRHRAFLASASVPMR
jgi:hypothetical protein